MSDLRQLAAQAATAAERLARRLSHESVEDPVVIAYLHRLDHANAKIGDYAEKDLADIEPDPNYLGTLR